MAQKGKNFLANGALRQVVGLFREKGPLVVPMRWPSMIHHWSP